MSDNSLINQLEEIKKLVNELGEKNAFLQSENDRLVDLLGYYKPRLLGEIESGDGIYLIKPDGMSSEEVCLIQFDMFNKTKQVYVVQSWERGSSDINLSTKVVGPLKIT